MKDLQAQIKSEFLPKHVAIIMDGNGRWAKKKGYLRAIGHENGVDALRNIATAAAEINISYLTVYAFSSENWSRPQSEVNKLMALLVSSLRKELKTLIDNEIRLEAIGNIAALPKSCQRELNEVKQRTAHHQHMVLTLALSYGSREEITEATRKIAEQVAAGRLKPEEIKTEHLQQALYTADLPDPDFLIRTSNELRISNYLLWQMAYTELYFTPVLWPDFGKNEFYEALMEYQSRERRFGKTSEQIKEAASNA